MKINKVPFEDQVVSDNLALFLYHLLDSILNTRTEGFPPAGPGQVP